MIAALWQATELGDQLTGPERYLRAHLWYVNGENENLRNWQEAAIAAGAGRISGAELGERFERDIAPFWKMASARLKAEVPSLPPDEQQFGSLAADYSRLRLEWARAVVDTARNDDQARAADAMQFEKDSNLDVARSQRLVLLASLDHRPRALANSRWIVAATNWLTQRRWNCIEPPVWIRRPLAPGDAKTDGPAARVAAGCRAQRLFMSGEYESLDEWLTHAADSISDLHDGSSTLDGIIRGLSDLFDYGKLDVMQSLGRAADWRRRMPHSVYPQLLQSLIFEAWAWGVRGTGAANSVSPQAWAIFALRAEMAAMGLREVVERANTNPLWYQLSLDVGLDQWEATDKLRSTFARGVAEKPEYWPLYTRMLRILMPRRHGSQEDIARFIKEVSTQPNGFKDFAKYARLYWSYSSLEEDQVPLFGGQLAVWSSMREGFMELLRQHPQSDFILNAYAKFSCTAQTGGPQIQCSVVGKGNAPIMRSAISGCSGRGGTPDNAAEVSVALSDEIACAVPTSPQPASTRVLFFWIANTL